MLPLKITKHGRERFHERVGYMPDEDIEFFVMTNNPAFTFVCELKQYKQRWFKCLVTVYPNKGTVDSLKAIREPVAKEEVMGRDD